jgi:hypothetical protein
MYGAQLGTYDVVNSVQAKYLGSVDATVSRTQYALFSLRTTPQTFITHFIRGSSILLNNVSRS